MKDPLKQDAQLEQPFPSLNMHQTGFHLNGKTFLAES